MANPQFELVFEKYLTASDVNRRIKQFIILTDDFIRFRTMLPPNYEQNITAGNKIMFLAQDQNGGLWRFSCKEIEGNRGKLFGQWIKFLEFNNIVENTHLRFEWAAAAERARLTFQLPIIYGGLQMVPNPIPIQAMGPNPIPIQAMGPNPIPIQAMGPNPIPIQAMGPNPNEESGSDSINSLTDLIDFENLEPENLELLEGVVNSPVNNEGEFLPPQSGAVNSLNQAVSFNTLGVNMNERLTKRIKTMQGTIQECLGVMAPCISNIQSETGKMAAALQELEKLLAPYDPSTEG